MLAGCDSHPDEATCNGYYRHLLELSTQEPPAFRIALQNSQARAAVVEYCLGLDRFRVQCSLNAGSPQQVTACETGPDSTFMERVEMEWDTISSDFDTPME